MFQPIERFMYCKDEFVFSEDIISDFNEFVEVIQRSLEVAGSAYVGIEPGDGNRYEFLITIVSKKSLVVSSPESNGWSFRGSLPPSLSPESMNEQESWISEKMSCVVSDFVGHVFDTTQKNQHFDWETGEIKEKGNDKRD